MTGGTQSILDNIEMELVSDDGHIQKVFIDVHDNSLSRKWLVALNHLLEHNYHLEKNYCFVGFSNSKRNIHMLCDRINESIAAINKADLGYVNYDHYTPQNTINNGFVSDKTIGATLNRDMLNHLHRMFEDLQGISGEMPLFYHQADNKTRWHIRQLNLLCHEYESLVLSIRKSLHAPEWRRPSQLMCWLNAPRFNLDENDFELFGLDALHRPQGGVFVGVNKAVGKHHWEVFKDEGSDSRVGELVTSTLRSQTEAAGDFDIEWAQSTYGHPWMSAEIVEFRKWLLKNNFDPEDKSLTIGHPQVGQVDLRRSFGSTKFNDIWSILETHMDVHSVKTSKHYSEYKYKWTDADYMEQQITSLG